MSFSAGDEFDRPDLDALVEEHQERRREPQWFATIEEAIGLDELFEDRGQ